MPLCNISDTSVEAKIFYRTYGAGPIKVLLIIGLAGTHDSWAPQILALTGSDVPCDDDNESAPVDRRPHEGLDGIQVCAYDNRGMGQSYTPTNKSHYSTTTMAKDAIALMDHLGWRKAHVFGHSMGGMIACKLASMVPHRILSLALLNVTGGGFECFPKLGTFHRKWSSSVGLYVVKLTNPGGGTMDSLVWIEKHYLLQYDS